jgi:DNA-binding HxlR family transcriptional regulator
MNFQIASTPFQSGMGRRYHARMGKRYDVYCPLAHALGMVGERWSLLIALELMRGPKRYTDLVEGLPGIGTNILAARLRDLEAAGVVERRILPPPAPAKVYELTEYGRGLKPVIRELALWGARSLGPPGEDLELFPGWLVNALDAVLAPIAPTGRFEFRVGDEIASLVDGEARAGSIEDPDVVVEGDPVAVHEMFVDGRLDRATITGDRELLERLIAAAPEPVALPSG